MSIENLSNQNHWEEINLPVEVRMKQKSNFRKLFKIFTAGYLNKLLWEVTLQKYIKKNSLYKVIEIGSAPGNNLIKWHNQFQHQPFGVEYTDAGLKANRQLFNLHNINPENIIKADFFSESFLRQNSEKYDAVFSMGFIEHFSDPSMVIKNHLDLLKPGGTLFISIPNLKGFYNKVLKIFYPEILDIHNLDIMEFDNFNKAFAKQNNLQKLFCGYIGTIDLNILQFGKYKFLGTISHYVQMIINAFCKIFFGKKGFETKTFSPFLIYIGTKKP